MILMQLTEYLRNYAFCAGLDEKSEIYFGETLNLTGFLEREKLLDRSLAYFIFLHSVCKKSKQDPYLF